MSSNIEVDYKLIHYNRYSDKLYRIKLGFTVAIVFLLLFTFISNVLAISKDKLKGSPHTTPFSLVGPKGYYLALGDSGALGFQPDLNLDNGYADDFFKDLKSHGVKSIANLGCFGESSFTFINYSCPVPFLRKYFYVGPQLTAALDYLHQHSGQVSPVTLDLGANDIVFDFNARTCTVSPDFQSHLQMLDINLTQNILPQLHAALVVNGQLTGDLLVMNYYDPYQNKCPNSVSYIQTLNQHLAHDVSSFGANVDVFAAFGGSKVPNNNMCSYSWMCSIFHDIHPTNKGYEVIATAFEKAAGY